MFCKNCGHEMNERTAFCGKCGALMTLKEYSAWQQTLDNPPNTYNTGDNFSSIKKQNIIFDDFKELWSVVGGIIGCIIFLIIYAFNDNTFCYWIAIIVFVFGAGSYTWYIAKFFIFYSKETNKQKDSESKEQNFSKLNKRALLNGVGGIVLILLTIVSIYVFNRVSSDLSPDVNKIKYSYLTQYSSSENIGDAFERFFDGQEWSNYKEKGTTYVVFSGMCKYNNNRKYAMISFELLGEKFSVYDVKIDGSTLNRIQVNSFLEEVFYNPQWYDGWTFNVDSPFVN